MTSSYSKKRSKKHDERSRSPKPSSGSSRRHREEERQEDDGQSYLTQNALLESPKNTHRPSRDDKKRHDLDSLSPKSSKNEKDRQRSRSRCTKGEESKTKNAFEELVGSTTVEKKTSRSHRSRSKTNKDSTDKKSSTKNEKERRRSRSRCTKAEESSTKNVGEELDQSTTVEKKTSRHHRSRSKTNKDNSDNKKEKERRRSRSRSRCTNGEESVTKNAFEELVGSNTFEKKTSRHQRSRSKTNKDNTDNNSDTKKDKDRLRSRSRCTKGEESETNNKTSRPHRSRSKTHTDSNENDSDVKREKERQRSRSRCTKGEESSTKNVGEELDQSTTFEKKTSRSHRSRSKTHKSDRNKESRSKSRHREKDAREGVSGSRRRRSRSKTSDDRRGKEEESKSRSKNVSESSSRRHHSKSKEEDRSNDKSDRDSRRTRSKERDPRRDDRGRSKRPTAQRRKSCSQPPPELRVASEDAKHKDERSSRRKRRPERSPSSKSSTNNPENPPYARSLTDHLELHSNKAKETLPRRKRRSSSLGALVRPRHLMGAPAELAPMDDDLDSVSGHFTIDIHQLLYMGEDESIAEDESERIDKEIENDMFYNPLFLEDHECSRVVNGEDEDYVDEIIGLLAEEGEDGGRIMEKLRRFVGKGENDDNDGDVVPFSNMPKYTADWFQVVMTF